MTKKKTVNKAVSTYILVDRSGSMAGNWDETLGSINAYVEELGKDSVKDDKITVAVFDSSNETHFDVVRDAVTHKTWKILTDEDATPRGGTPLYDSFGKMAALMEQANDTKSVIVVMTDGWENSSKEVDAKGAVTIKERLEKKGWGVIFLGADFDAITQAGEVGVTFSKTLNMTKGNYSASLSAVSKNTRMYANLSCSSAADAALDFSDEDRKIADGK